MSEVLQDMTVKQAQMTIARLNNPHAVRDMLDEYLRSGQYLQEGEVHLALEVDAACSLAEFLGGHIVRQSQPKRIEYARIEVEGLLINKNKQAIEFGGTVEITVSKMILRESSKPMRVVPFSDEDLKKLQRKKPVKKNGRWPATKEPIPAWMTGDEMPEPEMPELSQVRQEYLQEWQQQVADGQCIVGLLEWYSRRELGLPIPTPKELEL